MKIEVGVKYRTRSAGIVEIVEDLGCGRKRFVGRLVKDQKEVRYFRNGAYANSSNGGHPFDLMGPLDESFTASLPVF